MNSEPCLCGDPECRNCFPRYEEGKEYNKYDDPNWGLNETLKDIARTKV